MQKKVKSLASMKKIGAWNCPTNSWKPWLTPNVPAFSLWLLAPDCRPAPHSFIARRRRQVPTHGIAISHLIPGHKAVKFRKCGGVVRWQGAEPCRYSAQPLMSAQIAGLRSRGQPRLFIGARYRGLGPGRLSPIYGARNSTRQHPSPPVSSRGLNRHVTRGRDRSPHRSRQDQCCTLHTSPTALNTIKHSR